MHHKKTHALPLAYPFCWKNLERFDYPLDDHGIPQVDMGRRLGRRYNPITVAQYGLYNLRNYQSYGKARSFEIAENASQWLLANFREWRSGIGAWVYDFALPFYGPKAPWISGMAQAQGISLLLRIGQVTNKDVLLDISHRAFRAFVHPVADGGVASCFPDGALVFEEFPTTPPSLVLNGHMFALLGITEYATFWQDKQAAELFEVAVQGLKKNLGRYDTGYWNLYDLHPTGRLASPMYIKVHIQLLEILANLSGENVFLEVSRKWRRYLDSPVDRIRWLINKVIEKIRLRF
ncbi:MAG: D-glucuronyl C5-epimerase family protein [bacterium]